MTGITEMTERPPKKTGENFWKAGTKQEDFGEQVMTADVRRTQTRTQTHTHMRWS